MYITTETHANNVLRKKIVAGRVGFDTEYTDRRPTKEEQYILDALPAGSAARKSATIGWQSIKLKSSTGFHSPAAAFPPELKRILLASDISNVGVGILRDILVLWDDLRTKARHLVDAGLVSKLLLAEKYPKVSYGNLSLKTSVADVLGFEIKKDLDESDWSSDKLTKEQKHYTALDAVASLYLHDVLVPALEARCTEIQTDIPAAWFTFNTRHGEPTRMKRAADGAEVVWKPRDCTWYVTGKFQGYPDQTVQYT
ncbi:ribonuclease H-like domain-containing protein [Mycena capillaripes]|nr:ribonuclease H-like domain-containing protein [Mycena capillaripes]